MKVKYDPTVDAAYISLSEHSGDSSNFSFTYACDPSVVEGQIHLDFDLDGRLLGIEVLNASRKLPPRLIASSHD
jgi:uncharacterized protein YuzE